MTQVFDDICTAMTPEVIAAIKADDGLLKSWCDIGTGFFDCCSRLQAAGINQDEEIQMQTILQNL